MADKCKPEVNLEIRSGYFRIATDQVIYNLSIIPDHDGLPIVEKIVEVEKRAEASVIGADPDPYFREISQEALSSLVGIGRGLASLDQGAIGRRENDLDPQKIGEARSVLAGLKETAAKAGPLTQIGDDFAELVGRLQQVKALLDSAGSFPGTLASTEEEQPGPPASPAARRYLFDLDVVFQTLYELCTNETVKTHITTARENRDAYFDKAFFLERINERVVHLEPDSDNFLNVPISDVLASLLAACLEKPIQNLLKKMDSNQGTIFLDSVLPLEVPAVAEAEAGEEADSSGHDAAAGVDSEGTKEDTGQPEQATLLLDEVLQLVDGIAGKVAGEDKAVESLGGSGPVDGEFAERIDLVDQVLESALPVGEEEPASDQEFAALRQRLLEAVLTLHGEIRLKEEDNTLAVDEARQRAAAEAASKAATVQDQQDMEQLLAELGL